MKKIIGLFIVASIISCKNDSKVERNNYVTLSGKIIDKNSDSLFIYKGREFSKTIKVNEDGTFSDTLKVATGVYGLYDGNESSSIYLKNGYDLNMTLSTKEFNESISFSGYGSESSNYITQKALMEQTLYPPNLFDMEEDAFKSKIVNIESKLSAFLDKSKDLDSTLHANEKKGINSFQENILKSYLGYKKQMQQRIAMFSGLVNKPAPKFESYENVKGGKTSLNDLKGKYVYIDVWATWCGPCIKEIPSLKEVEKAYHDKKIEFVSISVDDGRGFKGDAAAARIGWQEMVADKSLGGTQLLADKGWKSDFIAGFKINSIPRFLLIDPNGVVVDADAPRPSSPKLRTLFDSLDM